MGNNQNAPVEVIQALQDTADLVSKGVKAADLASISYSSVNALAKPQNLSPLLTNLGRRETSFYQRVTKNAGIGEAITYNLVQGLFTAGDLIDPKEALYADGGLPTGVNTTFKNVTAPYKDMGYRSYVTGRSLRQMATWTDLEAREVENSMQRLVQAIDWMSFWSRDDVNNTAGIAGFPGLDQLITSNVIDAGSTKLTKALIDQMAKKIAYKGGASKLSHIFCSIGNAITLNDIFTTQQQLIVNLDGQKNPDLSMGFFTRYARTVAGEAEIVGNYFINPGASGLTYPQGQPYSASSAANGVATSTVFFLAMEYVTMEELLPISKVDLALIADKKEFMTIWSGAVALRAEPWCGKIINVLDS